MDGVLSLNRDLRCQNHGASSPIGQRLSFALGPVWAARSSARGHQRQNFGRHCSSPSAASLALVIHNRRHLPTCLCAHRRSKQRAKRRPLAIRRPARPPAPPLVRSQAWTLPDACTARYFLLPPPIVDRKRLYVRDTGRSAHMREGWPIYGNQFVEGMVSMLATPPRQVTDDR